MKGLRSVLAVALPLVLGLSAWAGDEGFKAVENKVVEKVLSNGLRVLILPRPQAPVTSFVTYADVGGVNEQQGATGLAHIFEHMAFKGTTSIGTVDIAKEEAAMAKEDEAFLALRAERIKLSPDAEKLKALEAAFKSAEEEAQKWVKTHEFDQILEREGSQGLNAFTGFDQTVYMYSLPSNKVELWATLEADRFTHPVLREFFKEKNVIMEERRMGEDRPTGRLFNDFFPMAFTCHSYRSFVIGAMSDLQAITRQQAKEWFKAYYNASNLTCAIVGDVDPEKILPVLEKHLGQIPTGRRPEPPVTVEPPQRAEKRMVMEDPSQPFFVIGYHRPAARHADAPVFEVLADLLTGGRSSRLNTKMVKESKMALMVQAYPTVEQEKFPGIFAVIGMPNKGRTNAECEAAVYAELERLKDEPVSEDELAGVKARAKMHLLDGLDSNMGLALQLASAQNIYGSWHELFGSLARLEAVTPADIQRVAKEIFIKTNRTVGLIENASAAPAKEAKP